MTDEQLSIKAQRALRRQEKLDRRDSAATRSRRQRWIFWIGSLVGVAGVVGLIILVARTPQTVSNTNATTVGVQTDDHVLGQADAPVTLIEYGDFQCPACSSYQTVLDDVIARSGDRLRFVFRNFPLTQIHANAQLASQAAEAAGLQGKFWEMHDLLYKKQTEWSSASGPKVVMTQFARDLKLDVDKFEKDLNSSAVKNEISTDVKRANDATVNSTPTFFLNGKNIGLPTSADQLYQLIQEAAS